MRKFTSIGFTGTRIGMTELQAEVFQLLLSDWEVLTFHHGDCVGADAQAHGAFRIWQPQCHIIIHPPTNPDHRAFCDGDVIKEPFPYMVRDHHIVDAVEFMLSTPKGPEYLRSGTWATIRYARKVKKPVLMIMPDGSVVHEANTGPLGI